MYIVTIYVDIISDRIKFNMYLKIFVKSKYQVLFSKIQAIFNKK